MKPLKSFIVIVSMATKFQNYKLKISIKDIITRNKFVPHTPITLSSNCHLLDVACQLHRTRLAYAWYLLAKCLTITCQAAQSI